MQLWLPNRECLFIRNVLKVGWLLFHEQRAVEICRAGRGAMGPGEPLRIEPALTRGRGSCCRTKIGRSCRRPSHQLLGSDRAGRGRSRDASTVVILAGPAAGCRHLAGRDWRVLLGTGGAMVTGLMGADIGPLSCATGGSALLCRWRFNPGATPSALPQSEKETARRSNAGRRVRIGKVRSGRAGDGRHPFRPIGPLARTPA